LLLEKTGSLNHTSVLQSFLNVATAGFQETSHLFQKVVSTDQISTHHKF
jgi:hypothetical protein